MGAMSWRDILNSVWGKVHEMIASNPVDVDPARQVYLLAKTYSELVFRASDPYDAIGNMLSAVALYGYAIAVEKALKEKDEWIWSHLPPYPVTVKIVKDSIPEEFIDLVVERVAKRMSVDVECLVQEKTRTLAVYPMTYILSTPLKTIIALHRNRDDIMSAHELLRKILDEMARDGVEIRASYYLECDDGVPEELRERGFKRYTLYYGTYHRWSLDKFKKVMRGLGVEVRRVEGFSTDVYVAEKWFGNAYIFMDCDTRGNGFVRLSFVDIEPKLDISDKPIRIENVEIIPITSMTTREVQTDIAVFIRRVVKIGSKLGLYLTEPLRMIGVRDGDDVKVLVNLRERRIIIEP